MSLDFYLEYQEDGNDIVVFSANITHNLNTMAHKAGIYCALWHPDEKGFKTAQSIIQILEKGLKKMKKNPEYFSKFNAENGWGLYKHFVPFVEDVLEACKKYPNAKIRADR
jgi:hypothetical protein